MPAGAAQARWGEARALEQEEASVYAAITHEAVAVLVVRAVHGAHASRDYGGDSRNY